MIGIAAGAEYNCALFENRKTKCWGINNEGQLGTGGTGWLGSSAGQMSSIGYLQFTASLNNVPISSLSAGTTHVCALFMNGALFCWGSGGLGRLGQNTVTNVGDASALSTFSAIVFSSTDPAVQVSAGYQHTCALFLVGSVRKARCWGDNGQGRLGQDSAAVSIGGAGSEMLTMGYINLPAAVTSLEVIRAYYSHTCASLSPSSSTALATARSAGGARASRRPTTGPAPVE